MIRLPGIILLFAIFTDAFTQKLPRSNLSNIDLSGEWNYRLDPNDLGIKQSWFSQHLEGILQLPGSLTTNNIGDDISLNTPWIGSIADSSYFKKDGDHYDTAILTTILYEEQLLKNIIVTY